VRGTTFAHRDGGQVVPRHRPRQRTEGHLPGRPGRRHFLELLAKLVGRFRVRLHVFVLMDDHYHLLLELAEANLGRTVQCLNVGCRVWYGDPGRGMALYLGQRLCGLKLAALAAEVGLWSRALVSTNIKRDGRRLARDPSEQARVKRVLQL
jgi:hypothetical protein